MPHPAGLALIHIHAGEPRLGELNDLRWLLLATEKGHDLFTINPATGVGTYLCTLKMWYNGLAIDANGLVFGAKGDGALWAIDVPARIAGDMDAEWEVGQHGNGGIEALEFAFGVNEARVEALGLDDEWIGIGLLFTYSEGNGFLIVNPATGAAIPYPCSMPSLDLEGIVSARERRRLGSDHGQRPRLTPAGFVASPLSLCPL
ncbi:MAG: hypothetical protein ACYS0G_06415 [Planctomycetota bacterium]